ncbi:MAG: hypothetical protein NWQ13_03950, partial [Glaciimonas sp.]|nr:hypothetical protein [Glaciimonas sp.]
EYYKAKDYPKTINWISRYLKEGGNDQSMRAMLIQSYYLNNEFAKASTELKTDIQAQEAAGKTPPEDQLQMLASLALKQDDKVGYINALEKIVAVYPQKKYWTYLLDHVQLKPGFSDGLVLDVY